MRIFEYDGEKFIVKEYWVEEKPLIDFKFSQIITHPEDERVLSAERGINGYSIKRDKRIVSFGNILYKNFKEDYHKIECSKLTSTEQGKILAKYIGWGNGPQGYYPHAIETPYDELRPIYEKARIDRSSLIDAQDKKTLKNLRYFLTSDSYTKSADGNSARMEGIINISEQLYLYHLLENEQFDQIGDRDISEIIKLFSKNDIICEWNANEVNSFDQSLKKAGIISKQNNYDKLMDKVKHSEKVLQKIKNNQ